MQNRSLLLLIAAFTGACSSDGQQPMAAAPESRGGAGPAAAGGAGQPPLSAGGGAGSKGGEGALLGGSGGASGAAGAGSGGCPGARVGELPAAPLLGRENIALHRGASSLSLGFPAPPSAFDGDPATGTGGGDWLVVGVLAVDLEASTPLYKSVVTFAGVPTRYAIEGSEDGQQWTPLLTVEQPEASDERELPAVRFRYVRFAVDTRNTPQDAWVIESVSEIELYARQPSDPLGVPLSYPERLDRTGWVASASNNSEAAKAAIDDQGVPPCKTWQDCFMCTNWSNGHLQTAGEWFQVDMGKPSTFDRVELNDLYDHPDNVPLTYDLLVSDDGLTWSDAIATGSGEANTKILFTAQQKRLIKVVLTANNPKAFWRIADFGVFNTVTAPTDSTCPPL